MVTLNYLPRVLFFLLFAWISLIPLPLQCRYPFQVKFFCAVGFLLLWARGRRSIFRNGDWPLWFFVLAIGFNLYGAVFWDVAAKTYLELIFPLIFIYYLMAEGLSREEDFTFVARTVCIFSLIVALWGMMDVLLRTNFLYESFFPNIFYDRYQGRWPMRAIATQFHAPPLGTYLLASLPFSFLVMRQDRALYRGLGILNLVVAPVVIFFTLSRGVLLSFFCMIVFILVVRRKIKAVFFALAGLALLAWASQDLPYPLSKFGFGPLLVVGDGLLTAYRFERIEMLGRILADWPLGGIGFQHVRELFYAYYPSGGNIGLEFRIMDNMYATLAAETGLLGAVSFGIFIGSTLAKGLLSFRRLAASEAEKTRVCLLGAGLFALMVNASAYELFYWPSQYMFFCIYLGLIESFFRKGHAPAGGRVTPGTAGQDPGDEAGCPG
ncbi:MAG: O-antigen ligase family protein [Candidatus Omnitrophica bacterium]|nr:O-antigen ligase family protein [Candidatus Omnitrophota bacterium]